MDTVLLNQTAERLADKNIRMNPCFIKKLGLVKTKTFLKIENYMINCVPLDFSLDKCRAVAILGAQELEFFREYTGTHQKLHLSLMNPLFSGDVQITDCH